MQKEWVKSGEVRARFGWSRATLDRHVIAGKFPRPVKWGGRNYWVRSEVLDWEAEHLRPATPGPEGK